LKSFEYGGAVGGLETGKITEHNKPVDFLVMSKGIPIFILFILSHLAGCAKG